MQQSVRPNKYSSGRSRDTVEEFPTTESQEREGWCACRKRSPRSATRSGRGGGGGGDGRGGVLTVSGVVIPPPIPRMTVKYPKFSGREDEDADAHMLSFEMVLRKQHRPTHL